MALSISYTLPSEEKNNGFEPELGVDMLKEMEIVLKKSPLFKHREVLSVSFPSAGIASFVAIIDDGERKFVFKTPRASRSLEADILFFNRWRSVGVSVPEVCEHGEFLDRSYMIMDYISAKTLKDSFVGNEYITRGVFREMGALLKRMHRAPQGAGYGSVVDTEATYKTFEEWVQDEYVQERIRYVRQQKIFDERFFGSIDWAYKH